MSTRVAARLTWSMWAISLALIAFDVLLGFLTPPVPMRVRRARGEQRQQLKWFVFAATLTAIGFSGVLISLTGIYFNAGLLNTIVWNLAPMALMLLPVSAGIAILRYRLYDIDRIINRTLVYGALTAILVGIYFGGVAATQAVLQAFTVQEKPPQIVVVASTLVIAALFGPLRRRMQALVDRRFYRRKYDAVRTLAAFNARLRDETELETLSGDVVSVVKETMQPAHVSLWLRPKPEPEARSAAPRQSFGHE